MEDELKKDIIDHDYKINKEELKKLDEILRDIEELEEKAEK